MANCSHAVASRRYCGQVGALGFEGVDVTAGAEVASFAGQQHHPHVGFGVAAQDGLVQRLEQLDIESVGGFRPVEPQPGDAVVADIEC